LTVPSGLVLQVAIDKETRVQKVGQPIQGRLVEAVYAYDRQVIPVGSAVLGRISALQGVSGGKRFLAGLNMNFTPARKVQVEFNEIVLPDGKHVPIAAVVAPGSGRTIRLATTAGNKKKKTPKDLAAQRMKEAIQEAKRKWKSAMQQVKEPGRMRRLSRFLVAQLPVHPQYLDAGTVYFIELQEPLEMGVVPLPPATTATEAVRPPCNLLAHAQLLTPLDSATTHRDAAVEAILSEPVFVGERLLFPQGSLLKGSVVQAERARRFKRNGKLRFAFRELIPPGGAHQEVNASLEGIQTDRAQNVTLDSEGGTEPTSPKRRYYLTGASVAMAVASHEDSDVEDGVSSSGGGAAEGAAGGAAAFKLVGLVVGALASSQPLSLGMGIFGASRSGYSNFVARGHELTFPKGTAMEVGLWFSDHCESEIQPQGAVATN
jgi:hypothetical protein